MLAWAMNLGFAASANTTSSQDRRIYWSLVESRLSRYYMIAGMLALFFSR